MSRGDARAARDGLGASADQVYPINGLLDLADLDQIAALDRPELKDEPWVRRDAARLAHAKRRATCSPRSARGDVLVHQPYESFATSVEAFVRAAATRPGRDRDEDDRVPDERRLARSSRR